jgi:hypothetical protein
MIYRYKSKQLLKIPEIHGVQKVSETTSKMAALTKLLKKNIRQ